MANEENIEFSPYEIDAVGEILNISMGSAATAVSELLNAKVWITTPKVNVVKVGDLNYDNLEPKRLLQISKGSFHRNSIRLLLMLLLMQRTRKKQSVSSMLRVSPDLI